MTTPKLKPCPFCGARPKKVRPQKLLSRPAGNGDYWYIPHNYPCFISEDIVGIYENEIAAWNRRAAAKEK